VGPGVKAFALTPGCPLNVQTSFLLLEVEQDVELTAAGAAPVGIHVADHARERNDFQSKPAIEVAAHAVARDHQIGRWPVIGRNQVIPLRANHEPDALPGHEHALDNRPDLGVEHHGLAAACFRHPLVPAVAAHCADLHPGPV